MIQIKTLIELFDECQIENVVSALYYKPEKIIYIGFAEIMTDKKKNDIKRFFKMKKLRLQICWETIESRNYKEITNRLSAILDSNSQCALDLTGGTEVILTAVGDVFKNRNIPTFQFDVPKGKLIKIHNCENLPEPCNVNLSIDEYAILNGGAVINNSSGNGAFALKKEFLPDIEKAWNIRTEAPDKWNERVYSLQWLENTGGGVKGLSVKINLNPSEEDMILIEKKIKDVSPLKDSGLIKIKRNGNQFITLSYKNRLVRQIFLKTGNIFELYTYSVSEKISATAPGYFSDIGIGVFMDWDGVIHSYPSLVHDTVNEIDIVLIRNLVPVFISCKSGDLKKEALYELDTVAKKFGGKYAKKIIVTNHVSHNKDTKGVLLQRAKDMNIDVIMDTDTIPKNQFMKLLMKKTN